jgi:hypothetical protein
VELEIPVAQVERHVALGALHHAVEHGVAERPREVALRFRVAVDAETGLVFLQDQRSRNWGWARVV